MNVLDGFKAVCNALLLSFVFSVNAYAINDALVQFDPTAGGSYSVSGINEFDWQSSGDLVIEDALPGGGSVADGLNYTSMQLWLANAVSGDTVSFTAHAQARLNDMLSNGGGSIAPNTLSQNGSTCVAGANCFEVTAVLDATFGATFISPGTLIFTTAFGNYAFLLDSTPDSDVNTGSGFDDGIAFLTGDVVSEGGSFIVAVGGNSFVGASINTQNTDVIEVDPDDGTQVLIALTYDVLISLISSGEAAVSSGGTVGLAPYEVQGGDLVRKADANTEFFSEDIEILGSCRMTGGGVDETGLVMAGTMAEGAEGSNRYQFGGQVGAPSATQPQPFGEWTHHQQKGPAGSFIFHGGTHSAPPGTAINLVTCSDEGFCNPARPAFFKQLDFEGVGTFKNAKGAIKNLVSVETKPNPSMHFFEVHIEDIGEPGPGGKQPNSGMCTHVPRTPVDEGTDCSNCQDIYQIRIHATTDPASEVIYNAGWPDGGFIDGGNLQIHPEVGQQPPKP